MILSHRIDITPTEVTQSTQFSVEDRFGLDEKISTEFQLTGRVLPIKLDKTAEMTTKALWSDHG